MAPQEIQSKRFNAARLFTMVIAGYLRVIVFMGSLVALGEFNIALPQSGAVAQQGAYAQNHPISTEENEGPIHNLLELFNLSIDR